MCLFGYYAGNLANSLDAILQKLLSSTLAISVDIEMLVGSAPDGQPGQIELRPKLCVAFCSFALDAVQCKCG